MKSIQTTTSAKVIAINFASKKQLMKIPGMQSKKISNNQELIQSDPISCPQNQKGNN